MLILTCTRVSFFHGSNDGQKGMGLIMLILIGTVPTTYALNRAMPTSQIEKFDANSQAASAVIGSKAAGTASSAIRGRRSRLYVAQHQINEGTFPSLRGADQRRLQASRATTARSPRCRSTWSAIPATTCISFRKRSRFLVKDKRSRTRAPTTSPSSTPIRAQLDNATKFIPIWVKIVVAIALGLGTMIGWKRIVVTVGEKIGKTHLTYAQGACAEITAAATIAAADGYGLPVSTTHVLSSGIAGTMAANGSGLQMATIRNIVMAWVLTLPAAMMLSGALYFVFSHLF